MTQTIELSGKALKFTPDSPRHFVSPAGGRSRANCRSWRMRCLRRRGIEAAILCRAPTSLLLIGFHGNPTDC